MPLKSLAVFLVFTICVYNDSYSNNLLNDTSGKKLPSTVMYELIDCANNAESLDHYMERYLLYPIKDKQLVPFYGQQDEMRAWAADSTNKLVLAQIVDSLRMYSIKKTDMVAETFDWNYKEYTNGVINGSKRNRFEFKKDDHVFSVTFHELRSKNKGWRIFNEVSFRMSNDTANHKVITCSSTLSVDPIALGSRIAEIIQAGKLEELFKYFPTEKVMEPVYKDRTKEFKGVLADFQETKNTIRNRFYSLKPGSYKVHNDFMHLQRKSTMPKDMDKGYYQFALYVDNSIKRFNLDFIILNEKIYVWRFKESEF